MKSRYISILLIICISASSGMLFSACAGHKSGHDLIHHTSKCQQLMDQYNSGGNSGVIDLSDGKKLNYDGSVGPGDPNFGARSMSNP